jgi:hypothetical protein
VGPGGFSHQHHLPSAHALPMQPRCSCPRAAHARVCAVGCSGAAEPAASVSAHLDQIRARTATLGSRVAPDHFRCNYRDSPGWERRFHRQVMTHLPSRADPHAHAPQLLATHRNPIHADHPSIAARVQENGCTLWTGTGMRDRAQYPF